MVQKINITILIAPLDWGLGHATRCIPIIRHLLTLGCNVIIATEGAQEKLLKTEFPQLDFVQLAGYNIRYANKKRFFALKIIAQLPKILHSVRKEKIWLKNFLSTRSVDVIISDNRYGLYNAKTKSIFITHQLAIKAPLNTLEKIIQFLNYRFIRNFTECWVPDMKEVPNLAGTLSHPNRLPAIPTSYIGGISRLNPAVITAIKYDILIVISGPEPQRTVFEKTILKQVKDFAGRVLFVRGLPGGQQLLKADAPGLTIKNHLDADDMEKAFNESEIIISRSGYTTVMDVIRLQRKSILIPTPMQTEQEYLAEHLSQQRWCLRGNQQNFDLQNLLRQAQTFQYQIPKLNMEGYKPILSELINNIRKSA